MFVEIPVTITIIDILGVAASFISRQEVQNYWRQSPGEDLQLDMHLPT